MNHKKNRNNLALKQKEIPMESANEHCQRGGSNDLDEREGPVAEEFFFGKYMEAGEFMDSLNKAIQPARAVIEKDGHEDGVLYLKVPFKELEQ